MSSAVNYDDVLEQLREIGLVVDAIEPGRLRRCKVDGDRERRGWYALHEVRLPGGDLAIVGAFGVWHGNDNNKHEVKLRRLEVSDEQKTAIRARIREDRKRAEAARRREGERASARARAMWGRCQPNGESPYLVEKQVQPHGVRFTVNGTIAIPMCDGAGNVHGLQFIGPEVRRRRKDRNKDFWPPGIVKRGRWFTIGAPTPVMLLAEGYATAASLYEATALQAVVAFDAGNLLPVAEELRKRYPRTRILVCADDDWLGKCRACERLTSTAEPACSHCGADTTMLRNAGREAADTAALAAGGAVLVPRFAERGSKKWTDFNDLHVFSGLATVRGQVEDRLRELGWSVSAAPTPAPEGGGERGQLRPHLTVDEANERYSLVYGGRGTLFDHHEHDLVPKPDVLDLLQDHGWKEWKTRPDRKVVRMSEVGFDPTGSDSSIRCNLWGGWPTKPAEGGCERLLELLEYMCSGEENARDLYGWILRWIAYPIQNPGAKMKTALIFHGPQGVGKNLFFEAVMGIYGNYGRIVDQAALEDKFNDWASKKLFLIGDEVVARQELYHTKNKLKALITGDWIRINPKNVAAHEERNHVNIVFLSNERQPLVLERDDRRYVVVWTPGELGNDFYDEVRQELKSGGVPALHHHLLGLELGDFRPWARPPMTLAKQDLIAISLDSVERFLREWETGETEFPFLPCGSMDLYRAYIRWCHVNGVQRPRESSHFIGHVAKLGGWVNQPCNIYENTHFTGEPRRQRMLIPPVQLLAKARNAPSENLTKSQWLTECFFEFRLVLENDR